MSDKTNSFSEEQFNIDEMLQYRGASFVKEKVGDSVTLIDLENSDSNAKNIDILLSSKSIVFAIHRSEGWSSNYLFVDIPKDKEKIVREIIQEAAKRGKLTIKKDNRIRGQQ